MFVRDAASSDAEACAAIYAHWVTTSAVSFETQPPSVEQMAERMATAHCWLVVDSGHDVRGYAYAGPYRPRDAYRWSCETSVYLAADFRRAGAGRALYDTLLARLTDAGYRLAIAGMTLPNDASRGLHRAVGFEDVGVYRSVGWKNAAWHDVLMMQRPLGPGATTPPQ